MADQNPHKNPKSSSNQDLRSTTQLKPISKKQSFTQILCKFIFFVLFLIAIPFFPSQAPNFINQTVLTKFWELVHLLFIGLAVCYGLFSRRNVDEEVDFDVHVDDSQSSYVSRIFHVSPIFEDGYQNLSESDEKNVYHNWDSQYYSGESVVGYDNDGKTVNSDERKMGSISHENGFEMSFENDENNNVIQAWNSQYYHGESMVVLSEANSALDESGNSGYKSLGLPVRSLNSRIRNLDNSQFSTGSESGSNLNGSSAGSGKSVYEKNFNDMGGVNLEDRYNETADGALASKIPQRSRSSRMEMREREGYVSSHPGHFRPHSVDETQFEFLNSREKVDSGRMEMKMKTNSVAGHPSHFRPLSVDETQFESLNSQSFQSTTSFSSHTSSMSYSPTELSRSNSVCSELPSSEIEELEEKNSFRASYPPVSKSPYGIMNGEPRLNAFHLRRYSSGSLFQKDSRGSSKHKLKDSGRNRREDSSGSKEKELSSSKSDKKPATTAKTSSRGKSVRTIRSSEYAAEAKKAGEMSTNHTGDEVGKTWDNSEAVSTKKKELKMRGPNDVSTGFSKKNLGIDSDIPNPTYDTYQKIEKEERSEGVTVESKRDSESKAGSFRRTSDEDAAETETETFTSREAGYDSYEVDRKAGEFIAKFREQIRLQKVASIERSKGMKIIGNKAR